MVEFLTISKRVNPISLWRNFSPAVFIRSTVICGRWQGTWTLPQRLTSQSIFFVFIRTSGLLSQLLNIQFWNAFMLKVTGWGCQQNRIVCKTQIWCTKVPKQRLSSLHDYAFNFSNVLESVSLVEKIVYFLSCLALLFLHALLVWDVF